MDNVFLTIKFATRYDSPGCIDIVDKQVEISEKHFSMNVSCRADKLTMLYNLELDLFNNVNLEDSYFEFSSVGRLYVNFTKEKRPERWRRLLTQTEKIPNMSLWWELHEKYEEELLNHTTFETDDNIENLIHIDNSRPKKKKDKRDKKSKKKSASKAKEDKEFGKHASN